MVNRKVKNLAIMEVQHMEETQRVAFVTGGSRGIGLAAARRLAEDGHIVAIGSRTPPETIDKNLYWVECDITDQDSVDVAFDKIEEKLGPVDILVANAGITKDRLVLRMDDEDFSDVLNANLTGSFRTTKRAIRNMMKKRWGRIVLVSSVVGSLGNAGQANYAASKAGLVGFGRSLAREFANRGITVNLVAPGPIQTDMLDALSDKAIEAMVSAVPMARVGKVEEIAATISFLTTQDAGYITGATIAVDGGMGMGG